MNDIVFILILSAALGSGLMAGVFFAFSTFIMQALALLQPEQGIKAMQEINRTVLNPWFLGSFMGTGVVCLGLALSPIWQDYPEGSLFVLVGSLLYLLGTFLVTVAFNVPMNEALERVAPETTEASSLWEEYLSRWTFWNHVRTAAALLGAGVLILAL